MELLNYRIALAKSKPPDPERIDYYIDNELSELFHKKTNINDPPEEKEEKNVNVIEVVKKARTTSKRSYRKCSNCRKSGHTVRNCPAKKKTSRKRVNYIEISEESDSDESQSEDSDNSTNSEDDNLVMYVSKKK